MSRPPSLQPRPDVPAALAPLVEGCAWRTAADGMSAAEVFEITCADGRRLFLKTEAAGPFSELEGEAARLRWLASSGLPCPEVIAFAEEAGRGWLLMTALAGRDLAAATDLAPHEIATLAADALRRLHALGPASCPFDARTERRIAQARARIDAGLVDEADFDAPGESAQALFAGLLAARPTAEDLVVTHGDATLPNLMAAGPRFTGFIDVGRLGIADRHQDLALMTRDLTADFGEPCATAFLQRYGGEADPERLAWFRLLDECF